MILCTQEFLENRSELVELFIFSGNIHLNLFTILAVSGICLAYGIGISDGQTIMTLPTIVYTVRGQPDAMLSFTRRLLTLKTTFNISKST